MGPGLNQLPAIKNANQIRVSNRAQSVCDSDDGPLPRCRVQGLLHELLRRRIERGSRLVEKQDAWVAQERTGNGETLLLTATEEISAGADEGGEAVA